MDHKIFYDSIRDSVNLTTGNVMGLDKVIEYAEGIEPLPQINRLAYFLATAWWETGQTMHPVKEAYWLSEDWRKKHLRYYPYYGRGLVQTTWKDNYAKLGEAMGMGDRFVNEPDLLLSWEYALPALFVGMSQGLYTGKTIQDYIDDLDESDSEDFAEYVAARKVVNGTDRAQTIAKIALAFEHGLKDADYGIKKMDDGWPVLRRGDKGQQVVQLQKLLGDFYTGPQDGDFGPGTEYAVTKFQKQLIEYGVVGRLTWEALGASLTKQTPTLT